MNEPEHYRFYEQYFEGRFQPGSSSGRAEVRSPWSGETLSMLAPAGIEDVDRAYTFAGHAQHQWADVIPGERAAVFGRAARLMDTRRAEIVDWLVRESGSTIQKAQIEWWATQSSLLEAQTLPSRLEGRILFGNYPGKESRIYRKPVGVVTVISPWNWPLHPSMRSVAPALALGNAVVLKPAFDTPISGGLLIAKLFEEAGLPPGVLSVLCGRQ